MPHEYDTHTLQRRIEQLSTVTGRGTELVSVYVPPETSLSTVRQKLTTEYGEAANIKSKRTRTNVQDALKSIQSHIKAYEKTPETGLVAFSGAVEDEAGKSTIETVVLDTLPAPIQTFRYHCDSTFLTAPLLDLFASDEEYGLIVFDKRDAHIGTLAGSRITHHGHISSLVPGKHKAGGQSQRRFERLRLDAANEFYKKIADLAYSAFGDRRHTLSGILVGGPSPTKEEFLDGDYLHHELDSNIIAVLDVSDTTENGLNELVERGRPQIRDSELAHQKDLLDDFFQRLREGTAVAYGKNHVEVALRRGAVETLLVSEEQQPTQVESLIDQTEQYGGTVELVSTGFEKGKQFNTAFDGVGAILRYDVDADGLKS